MVRLMEGEQECNNRTQTQAGKDGEIKGPGPFRSIALMVLRFFRDLALDQGPGFADFPRRVRDLSGTFAPGARP